jgi:hypothetical protein
MPHILPMNLPTLCNKPDIDLKQYPELATAPIAFAALTMSCEFLSQTVGGDAALWLDRFSNAVQLMTSPAPSLDERLTQMMITLMESWEKLQVESVSQLDEPLYLLCQMQLDGLRAILNEWQNPDRWQ